MTQSTEMELFNGTSDNVTNDELESLLCLVYVDAGFTDATVAKTLFAAEAVRARGDLFIARDLSTRTLAGMVIVTSWRSATRQIAAEDEAEMQLLAVHPAFRRYGLGNALIRRAMAHARKLGFRRMVLSTQASMHSAHRRYEEAGFKRSSERDWKRASRDFLAFVVELQ